MKRRQERLARLFIASLILGLALSLGFYRLGLGRLFKAGAAGPTAPVELHAQMAETGGWTPGDLQAEVGQPLRLRLTSDDVVHSFAVGQTDWPVVQVEPGKFSETELLFERPGKYTFYCTRWCGADHWRMRGTIQVNGTGEAPETEKLLYLELGLDLDAQHPAAVVPSGRPSAERGRQAMAALPERYSTFEYYAAHSPAEAFLSLRDDPALTALPEKTLWDLTAALWAENAAPEAIEAGRELYAQNCAACHGETGKGDGVMARHMAGKPTAGAQPAARPEDGHSESASGGHPEGESSPVSGHELVNPADFTDPVAMLGASPALLQGKILRGGMGTGMPYWGPVFTEEQTWALVAYLWTFVFDLESNP
jgi:mono/diheme cytochrome c family protein/plastocyanin